MGRADPGPDGASGMVTSMPVSARGLPKIISVDDHVVEPPHVWQDRLPEKYKDAGPRIVIAPRAR